MARRSAHPGRVSVLVSCLLVGLAADAPAEAAVKLAFVTTTEGGGDLSSWPEASGTGLAAADAVCQARAAAAGLPAPTSFKAWLSTPTQHAACRMRNLSGTVGNRCGLPAIVPLPSAGPWALTNGEPFAASIDDLLAGVVFNPADVDETGTQIPFAEMYWTGTTASGAADTATCTGWTSTSGSGLGGDSAATTRDWTQEPVANTCSNSQRLLCMQFGAGSPLPPLAAPGRRAFVGSVALPGSMGGVGTADTFCGLFARSVGLAFPDTFKAWLSTADVAARDRFENDGPWVRVDGIRFVENLADFADFTPTSLNVTETGEYLAGELVWTGSHPNGTAAPAHCDSWTDASATGAASFVERILTTSDFPSCAANHHVYCLSDAPGNLLFADGFEAEDLRWWTGVAP